MDTLIDPSTNKPYVHIKIQIRKGLSGLEFPYGQLSKENKKFIEDFVGEEFPPFVLI